MLIRFNISNFLSFKEKTTISMVKGATNNLNSHVKKTKEVELLRTAAVFGKNAAGKSNIVKSLRTMKSMVLGESVPVANSYFRPDMTCADKESYFEVEVEIDGRYYSYGFTYHVRRQKICDEWLYQLSSVDGNKIIYQRSGAELKHHFETKDDGLIGVLNKLLRDDKLFITLVGQILPDDNADMKDIRTMYEWFSDKLQIIDTNNPFIPTNGFSDEGFARINEIMSGIDAGVNRIDYERNDDIVKSIPEDVTSRIAKSLSDGRKRCANLRRSSFLSMRDYRVSMSELGDLQFDEIVYRHGDTVFHSEEESDGTKKMYGLVASIVSEEKGVTFVIDEIDSRLHPMLTVYLVRLFCRCAPKNDSQFVFTSHADTIMEKNILRRDEILFIEKDEKGESEIYSLEDFREKSDRRIRKAYREGRYGAIPMIAGELTIQ